MVDRMMTFFCLLLLKSRNQIQSWLSGIMAGLIELNIRHWIIAAKLGEENAVGFVSKEDFITALRAHQDAVEETKSQQREAAEAVRKSRVK